MSQPVLRSVDAAYGSVSFDGLQAAGDRLLWLESGGDGTSLGIWSGAGDTNLLNINPGSALHAYGGGAFTALGDRLWYVDSADGQIWERGSTSAITSELGILGDLFAFQHGLLAIRENDHGDELLFFDIADGRSRALFAAPFLSSPRWHAGALAWITWPENMMPWDSSELWLSEMDTPERLHDPRRIAGGPGISVVEPQWSPDGILHFISDDTGWWNLYRWTPQSGIEPVAPIDADCAAAPWEHGYSSYTFLPGKRIAIVVQRGPRHELAVIDQSGVLHPISTPFTAIKPYLATHAGRVAMIAASPSSSQKIVLLDPERPPSEAIDLRSATSDVDSRILSLPQQLTCKSDGVEISISYYPALHGDVPSATIVRAHSGPTYQSEMRLDWETQFFTSRGFAIADVDYRGSTGFGRAFRKALDGRWGELDVDDCRAAATYLVTIGLAEPGRLIVAGASAGGYTALRAVMDPHSPFSMAVVRSAVVDPETWRVNAPRFQRPHAAVLASVASKVDPARICRPIAAVHGTDDAVAPISEIHALLRGLRSRHARVHFLELEGVGHFPSGLSLAASLDFELAACLEAISDLPGRG